MIHLDYEERGRIVKSKEKLLSGQEAVSGVYGRLKVEHNGWDLGLPPSFLVGNLEVTSAAFIEMANRRWLLVYAGAKGSTANIAREILVFSVDDKTIYQITAELRSAAPDAHSLIRVLADGRIDFASKSRLGIEMSKVCSRLGKFSVKDKEGLYQQIIVDFLGAKVQEVLGQIH